MITIVTTIEEHSAVAKTIASVHRLDELVTVTTDRAAREGDKIVYVTQGIIKSPIDWFDTEPPYRYPDVPLTESNLLAVIFDKLGNQQQAFQWLSETDKLYPHLLAATYLRFGYEFTDELIETIRISSHNEVIVQHYGNVNPKKSFKVLRESYTNALDAATDKEMKSYTAKHYLNLLIDGGLYEDAIKAARLFLDKAGTKEATLALKIQLATALFKNLSVPYDQEKLKYLGELQSECIAELEQRGLQLNVALLAMDACDVANFRNDFPQAKTYITKAIQYFKEENIDEFLGEAGLKKAHLLYNWSKNGSPQYYKAAINAFQDTLKVFKRDRYPEHFADVQHNLGLIYSEIPAAEEEKPIWTAFSASAFKEALRIYTKEGYPYEHAMVCHNYATALMHFPPAKLHDNFKRSNGLFEEALKIRTAEEYPMERALTLLNQLELAWLMHNADNSEEGKRYAEMKAKAHEVKALVQSENLLAVVTEHLSKLEQLKEVI